MLVDKIWGKKVLKIILTAVHIFEHILMLIYLKQNYLNNLTSRILFCKISNTFRIRSYNLKRQSHDNYILKVVWVPRAFFNEKTSNSLQIYHFCRIFY
jgi:hypothetical protein